MDFKEIFGSNKPRCQAFKEDGSRCKTDPQTGSKFCFMHDPGQKEKQAEARRKGGEARNQLYPRKIPPNFRYQAPQDHYEVEALLDQIALYYTQDEMDLRSARFYCYIVMGKLGIWNSFARLQSRVSRDAENKARIQRREKDPWCSDFGVMARAKAKEEAEKAAQLQFKDRKEKGQARAQGDQDNQDDQNQDDQLSDCSENHRSENPSSQKKARNKYENDGTGPLILGTTTMSFVEMQAISKRVKEEKRAEQAQAPESTDESTDPKDSGPASEAMPPKRPPQSVRNKEEEQRQQRMYQSAMSELTERAAEQVRAEAYKKGEWRRKRRW